MAKSDNLREAKRRKNDEFYTLEQSIVDEIDAHEDYVRQFRGKSVYCNCDSEESSFVRFFLKRFKEYGLKKLTATHWNADGSPSCKTEWVDDGNGPKATRTPLQGDGDFRSEECVEILKEADIVATNPPFSLFREYVRTLISYEKKFIIIGNQNASTTKEIFPLIKENKIWYGASIHSGGVDFRMPDDYDEYSKNAFIRNGHHYINLAGVRWFTNMDVKYRHDGLWHKNGKFDDTQAHCYYEGNESHYATYEDYEAINVETTEEIPIDYAGVMGVPITWFDKYNPDEFELLGIHEPCVDIETVRRLGWKEYKSRQKMYKGKLCQKRYHRMFVRNRNPIKKADDRGY